MKNVVIILGTIVIIPLAIIYISFSWGYVATIMADWFISPIFPEFPKLSVVQYAGIMFFASCFFRSSSQTVKKEFRDEVTGYVAIYIGPWLTLFAAWVINLFL